MTINQKVAAFFGGLALAGSLGLAEVVTAEEINPQGFPKPNVEGLPVIYKDQVNFDKRFPDKETTLTIHRTPTNGRILVFSVGDKTFAYGVDSDLYKPVDYGIVDKNGDGIFETKVTASEKFGIPPKYYAPPLAKE